MVFIMKEYCDSDELAFYLDMAMNESQRWLEVLLSFLIYFQKIESFKFSSFCYVSFLFR
ncbi:unnamed protein product [Brugia timori]|uniref:Uncharacterized protein n=1 Tax=Brugia timori TaxID=42155 RepID=A0A0R3QUJ4_9BILA|nr:unnamed protein product [Brugia timori]